MSARVYQFSDEAGSKKRKRSVTVDRELRMLLRKQQRWLTRIRRAMTAISKIERKIKRLDA